MCVIGLSQLTINPDLKDGKKKILNKVLAAIFIFFLPVMVNAVLAILPESFTISACWEEGKRIREISKETKLEYKTIEDIEKTKIVGDKEYENSNPAEENNSSNNSSSNSNNTNLVETNGVLAWPSPGNYTITSTFGYRTAPTAGASSNHKGIDISCAQGSDVTAAYDGTVAERGDGSNSDGYNGGRGYYLLLNHTINGNAVTTQYYHLSEPLVTVGTTVTKGQVIAKSGGDPSTAGAGASTGSHLHFGVYTNGANENPCNYLGLSSCSGDVSADIKK
jgi:murein DD-endopeptidase MepM/ murein hydrolase activator NlpD